jgi:hypothetical protein
MVTLHWNYKDLFRACRLGFSAKKIWMQVVGFVLGGVGYSLLTYIAYLASGVPVAAVWERFSLIPFFDPYFASPEATINLHWWSWTIWALGILYYLAVALVTATAVAKVTIEQLRGDDFFEVKEAFKFALDRFGVLVAAPAMPVLFAALITVVGLVLSLVGAIPVVGDLVLGLAAIPAFAASLFIIYLLIIFVYSLFLVPVIAGLTRNDSFDTLFEVFSCVGEQPWRLLVYSIILGVLSIAATAILGWFSLAAAKLGVGILHVFAPAKMASIASGGPYYLRLSLPSWCPLYRLIAAGDGTILAGELTTDGVSQNVAAILFGSAAYIVLLFILGYGAAIWNTGMTLTLAILTRKKDGKNLLEEKETDELLTEPEPEPPDTSLQPPATSPGESS